MRLREKMYARAETVAGVTRVNDREWDSHLKSIADATFLIKKAFFQKWKVNKLAEAGDDEPSPEFNMADMPIDDVVPFQNPIQFWVQRKDTAPFDEMYEMAMSVLCIPGTEAASERTFKHTKLVRAADRSRLGAGHTESLVIVGRGLRAIGVRNLRDFTAWQHQSPNGGSA